MTASIAASTLAAILDALDPEQRAAATLPDGPAQIIAPAGSGKTTTMVARLAVLLDRGVVPSEICVVTFNRAAALDLAARVERRLGAVPDATRIEIRTLHALSLRILGDAGVRPALVADRLPLLRAARRQVLAADPTVDPPDAGSLDAWLSLEKIEGRPAPDRARATLDAFARLLRARGAVDFDDLVVGAADRLEADRTVRDRWQGRFRHVCVDEFQDVDAAQLRLVRLLAAPEDNLFVVGDDDQTIYAWRLADVRRILTFGDHYPGARRVMLATNYRCPRMVVEASARLVAVNRERFAKPIRAPAALPAAPAIVATPSDGDDWPDRLVALVGRSIPDDAQCCILARTRAELELPMLALTRHAVPHRAPSAPLVESPSVLEIVDGLREHPADRLPFHAIRDLRERRGWLRAQPSADELADEEHAAIDALLGWAVPFTSSAAFLEAFDAARARMATLRDPNARVELATAHGSKGREWETVILVGFEAGRMPNDRSIAEASDPARALEEERRLAYVALTRATRRLVLAFDPARPSPFLAEMGLALQRRGVRRRQTGID